MNARKNYSKIKRNIYHITIFFLLKKESVTRQSDWQSLDLKVRLTDRWIYFRPSQHWAWSIYPPSFLWAKPQCINVKRHKVSFPSFNFHSLLNTKIQIKKKMLLWATGSEMTQKSGLVFARLVTPFFYYFTTCLMCEKEVWNWHKLQISP